MEPQKKEYYAFIFYNREGEKWRYDLGMNML